MDDVRLCAATDRKARFFNCCLDASRTITNAAAAAAACRRIPRRACVTMKAAVNQRSECYNIATEQGKASNSFSFQGNNASNAMSFKKFRSGHWF
jgi:hypothetical protein